MPHPQKSAPKAQAGRKSAASFQDAIEKAVLAGVPAEGMTLRLTLRDASVLRRDRSLPVEAISFAGGEMQLLGVKVIAGGVEVSTLELPEA